jgi:hypothetical protein
MSSILLALGAAWAIDRSAAGGQPTSLSILSVVCEGLVDSRRKRGASRRPARAISRHCRPDVVKAAGRYGDGIYT